MSGTYSPGDYYTRTLGLKQYEGTNHLGNVISVFTDIKIARSSGGTDISSYMADVVSATDYYPFGMVMAERSFGGDYRFGFNGKENDDEVKGEGNSLDFGARIYDSRIGSWLSLDPLQKKYPNLSPYNFCYNSPIVVIDPDGREGIVISGQPGDHGNKLHFLVNGLDRAKGLAKQFAKEGNGEGATWFIYNSGGAGGFDKETIAKYTAEAAKYGIAVQVVTEADKIVEYVNEKNGGDSRTVDQVSNLFYLGHATPGDLDVGFEDHDSWNMLTNDKIEPSDFDSEAFKSGCNIDVVGGCRTAVDGNLLGEKSVVDQFAGKVDPSSIVKGSDVRVYYPGGVVSNKQLVKPNKGNIIEKKGTKSP